MITVETYWDIHRLHTVNGLTPGQIAEQLHISETTVNRWLDTSEFTGRKPRQSNSLLDPYKPQIDQLLQQYPYSATQLFQHILELEYSGSYSTVRRYVEKVRPPHREAYLELSFEPGEAAQVDFGSCGLIPCGNTTRRLSVFMLVLCHSRLMYCEFLACERMEQFLTCQKNAFEWFNGVPRRVIVDNCRCAVLRHARHGNIQFNPRYLDFAGHYGFEPVACNVQSPHEKGVVENGVGYLKKNFLPGRSFTGLEQANSALRHWLDNIANMRIHGKTKERPADRFRRDEKKALNPLPADPFDCAAVETRRADKRCRIWFDSNCYSVPARFATARLTIKAKPKTVLIYDQENLVTRHARCYDRNRTIVNPDHTDGLRKQRKLASDQNLMRDFLALGPAAEAFHQGLELKQINPRHHMRRIMALVEMHGADPVADALDTAAQFEAFRAEYIENLLMQRPRSDNGKYGTLHVPRAADLLDLRLDQPDMSQYKIED